jgi:hypothetical protein
VLGKQSGLAASTSISNGSFDASLAGVAPGTYYIVARATDSSDLQRYYYSEQQITIAAAIAVTTVAHSNPGIVTGNSTHLIAAATDAAGGGDLTYTWSFTHLPAGAAAPSISKNGTNASQKLGVTFFKQGGYRFTCTITDSKGNSTATSGMVTVEQTPTKMEVTPVDATIPKEHARKFSTVVVDQFGRAITTGAGAVYSIVSGPATIGALNGIFTAGNTTGTALINVDDDGLSEIVDASVVN